MYKAGKVKVEGSRSGGHWEATEQPKELQQALNGQKWKRLLQAWAASSCEPSCHHSFGVTSRQWFCISKLVVGLLREFRLKGSLGKMANGSHSFFPVTLDSTKI